MKLRRACVVMSVLACGHTRTHAHTRYLSLVRLVALGAVVRPVVRVGAHVLAHVPDGLVELAALAALVAPLAHVHVHVLLQQVARQELLLTQCAPEGLVTCGQVGGWVAGNMCSTIVLGTTRR